MTFFRINIHGKYTQLGAVTKPSHMQLSPENEKFGCHNSQIKTSQYKHKYLITQNYII